MVSKSENKYSKVLMWIVFLIYPLGAFVFSLKDFSNKKYRLFIFLFFLFFSITYIPIVDSDGYDYKNEYISHNEYSSQQYFDDISDVINGKSINTDFYFITIRFISLQLSKNYKVFFFLIGLVYFFVFLRFQEVLIDFINKKSEHFYISFFVGCWFIYNLSAGVNGIRYPLAFWVFSYGALNLILKNEWKYLLIASLSIFVHFALSFSVLFLFVFYFLKYFSNKYILYTLLVFAFLASYVFPTFLSTILGNFSGSVESKVTGYTNEGFVETRAGLVNNWNWYVQFNQFSVYYFSILVTVLSKFKFFKINTDEISDRFFGFTLVMLISSLISGSIVDSVSNRYALFVNLFGLVYILYLSTLNYKNKFIRFANYAFIPILIINIFIKFRSDFYCISPVLVFGNSIVIFFVDSAQSIQEFLGG